MDTHLCQNLSPDSNHSGGELSPVYYEDRAFQRWQRFTYKNSTNALQLWNSEVKLRNKLEDYVAGKTHRKLPELLMNSTKPGYDRMLHNELMDRILPLVSNGKTARLKSEFWFQPEVVGRFYDEGIRFSRTKRDQGILPPLEHVGCPKPKSFKNEPQKPDDGINERQALIGKRLQGRHPWHILSPLENKLHRVATYEEERLASLKPLINELVPIKPALEDLIIVGTNTDMQIGRSKFLKKNSSVEGQWGTNLEYSLEHEKTYIDSSASTEKNKTDMDSNYTSLPMMFSGCALKVNNNQFFCLSENASDTSPNLLEIELTFEVADERPCHKSLTLCNNGSLVIFYEWRHIPKLNAFEHPQDSKQTFFFNMSNGIIRPGEEKIVPVSFQSCREGVYAETWAFWTRPCLIGQHAITVRLFGSALWSHSHSDNVWELESPLDLMEKRATYRIMRRIIDEILNNLHSKTSTESTPILEKTEEDVFKAKNPLLYYAADGVENLRKLMDDISSKKSQGANREVLPEAATNARQWDLSVETIKQEILEAHRTCIFSTPVFADFLRRLYTIVDGLTKKPLINTETVATERYRITYHHIADCLMKSFDHCSKAMMSLNMDENSHDVHDNLGSAVTTLKAPPVFQDGLQNQEHDSHHHVTYDSRRLAAPNLTGCHELGRSASTISDVENQQYHHHQQQQQPTAAGGVTVYGAWREKSEVLVREELRKAIAEIIGVWFEMK